MREYPCCCIVCHFPERFRKRSSRSCDNAVHQMAFYWMPWLITQTLQADPVFCGAARPMAVWISAISSVTWRYLSHLWPAYANFMQISTNCVKAMFSYILVWCVFVPDICSNPVWNFASMQEFPTKKTNPSGSLSLCKVTGLVSTSSCRCLQAACIG